MLLQNVYVNACDGTPCVPATPDPCCEGFVCVADPLGGHKCEPEGCEDHEDHPCEPGVRECCEGLVCVEDSSNGHKCEPEGCESHEGHSCVPGDRECCSPLVCVLPFPSSPNYECH